MPSGRIDERDIMFSRRRLIKDTERYEEYYSRHPENLDADNRFRSKPGLLNPDSQLFDKFQFSAAEASFSAVETLNSKVDGIPAEKMVPVNANNISDFLKGWINKLGAVSVGITEMKEWHWYSHIGRGDDYGKEVDAEHKFGIAFTVEMDREQMSHSPHGPTVMESASQYLNAGAIAVQVAEFIRSLGYNARAHIDGNYRVVCPLVARDAGLGELGRMGLLMTPELGPRVRIAVVTTDMPLVSGEAKDHSDVIEFCRICKKCADVCPSRSISFNDREIINGVNRWQINSETCFTLWCTAGTDCGRCMYVCPFSHPDTLLHNFVRRGIRRNKNFRKTALLADDFFYGRKPAVVPVPDWKKTIKES
jgi:reductive dehalogenase